MFRRLVSLTGVLALGASAAVVGTSPADARAAELGTRSLAKVLAADGAGFDKRARDFDILDNAVRAVLDAKPDSAVKVLADGTRRLTAFAPTDGSFRRLVEDLTGTRYPRERRVFTELAGAVGVDTVEQVLLYHVVPGVVITSKKAAAADGAVLTTALGKKIRVNVRHDASIHLRDADRDDKNARVLVSLADVNKGNRQIAHGITQVLRPADL